MSDKVDKEAKRRRRRRAGLRVPSDNVPRAKSASDVTAPAPEDPRLAVSVAYAFSNGSSSPAAAEPGTDPKTDPRTDSRTDIEDEAGIRDTIRSGPKDDELGGYSTDQTIELDAIEDLDSIEDLSSYEGELTEASAEHPAVAEGELDEHPPIELDEEIDPEATVAGPPPTPEMIAAMRDDFPADAAMDTGESTPEPGPGAPPADVSGDSVDIAFDEEDQAETAPRTDSPADQGEKESGERAAAGKRRTGVRFVRASTVALTDQDLEEMMEADSLLDADFDARATLPLKPLEPVRVSADEDDEDDDDGDDESGVVQPHDAGDSGEIIADDMIEEIEENAIARPVHPEPEVPDGRESPEATQGSEASESGDDEPRRVEVSEPPPPPKVKSKPKPPPAPATEAPRRRGKGKMRPWFEEVFDENYLRTLPFLTPQATEAEASFVIDSLGLDVGSDILDVGCGYGRHSMELAARGYSMHGLDLSLPLLMRGADEAQRRGLDINFVHGDMREMQFDAQFDGAFCLFATFGYFDDETNKKTAQQIARALKPGARLVLEVLNRDYLIRDLPTRVWWEGDGCVILEEVDFNYFSSRIVSTRSIAFDDGRQIEQEISIRAFSLHELGKLLHAAGFRVVEISGAMVTRGRFFGGQSRDIIVVAEKPAKGNGH